MSTKICKKRPLAISEMLSQTLIAARSHPSFQNLKITTQTQETKKTEKQKLVVTFEDKIFAKSEKFGSEKQYHSKTEPCPILFDQKDSRSSKRMFDKRTPRPQPNQKTGQTKEGKKSTFTSSNKRMLIDSVNSNLPILKMYI